MDFNRPRNSGLREGWALMDKLVKNPYASRFGDPEAASYLCAEFKRMVFEDGVPVRPSKAHSPDYIALTETELRDMTHDSRATIHGLSISLRELALEKFPPLCNPETSPPHILEPVESAQVVVLFPNPRQLAASVPSTEFQPQMKG